ncbi:hypothetical protein AKJ43_03065 [candidate division MSBL1 archaeon SCGC-AAA261D19]|uniref:Cell division protein FtsZ n=3 Tax=candidate division MSBL1 TaxID=215777 RepID=A0A133V5Y2_9EURY|nr:hypothetical protein AKJ43_03065 [candidate division MSBL1 archaeon SCGC-AAA261D19]KXB02979.1 hypothetical protein AKJ47_03035 [candidate division MSBL1 archaeon SCGC-AAA261G05]KXB04368.1 hypothetical protein AKJ48_02865 [candidate division MSBL1 archaeon SCGC-AAA261O19]
MSGSYSENSEGRLKQASRNGRPTILVVGCGGAGCNTITRVSGGELRGAETIAVNTDAQDLLNAEADEKVLIGREVTNGLGAGGEPKKGRESALKEKGILKEALSEHELVFLTYGLGGGTGTGAGPVIGEIAKESGALTVAVVTLPFEAEGEERNRKAVEGLSRMEEAVDTTIVIPDDRLLEITPDLSLPQAFERADKVLKDAIAGVVELATEPGLINLDFEDILATFEGGGTGVIGFGKSTGERRVEEAVEEALGNPLLDMDVDRAERALIAVRGSPDVSLREAEELVEKVSEKLDPDARIAWGARTSEDLEDSLKVMIMVGGAGSDEGTEEMDFGLESL